MNREKIKNEIIDKALSYSKNIFKVFDDGQEESVPFALALLYATYKISDTMEISGKLKGVDGDVKISDILQEVAASLLESYVNHIYEESKGDKTCH